MIHYPRHIGDWMKDTASLSMLEEAAYSRLVDQYYTGERPLPAQPPELYRLARAKTRTERAAVDYVVAKFFRMADDGLRHRRCDAEVQAYQDRAAKARRSAELRWKRTGTAKAAAEQMPAPCEGTASHKPITIKQENNVVVTHAPATDSGNPDATPALQPEPDDTVPEPRFAMHDGWQPGAGFAERLQRAGITPLTPALLTEFVSYRIGVGGRQTQAVWEHKLLLRLEQLMRRPAPRAQPSALAVSTVASPAERVRAAAARARFAVEAGHE